MPMVAALFMTSSGSLNSIEACALLGVTFTVDILRLIGSSSRGHSLEEENRDLKPVKVDLRPRLLEFGGMGVKEGYIWQVGEE
jgi:sulfopyruvate decarboxylase TPP-binding subunit